jgi:hypothetical protein
MPRISDRKIVAVFLALALAFVASCASPNPPARVHVQGPADPCRKYDSPTQSGRCHLFTSADGWRFIPEVGRTADLDTQIRCAPVAPDLNVYAECIGKARAVAVAPDAGAVEPAAASASRAPIKAEPVGPDVAADEFEQLLREVERLDAALWTPPRTEPTAPAIHPTAKAPTAPSTWRAAPRVDPSAPATIARSVPKSPTVAKPGQSTRGSPLCAENGSCYGDISSKTGRLKTVYVGGYYRKDGTYVRGHYRSRPRR